VVAVRRPPKFNVTIAGTERFAAEHAVDGAAVDKIPAAREHRDLSTEVKSTTQHYGPMTTKQMAITTIHFSVVILPQEPWGDFHLRAAP
jgi:hypothetical protein